jgi:polysaccharide pyruvyl transferase CsaB
MPISKNYNSADPNQKERRCLVIITGYYGFDNLGDEAILEELLHEVSSIIRKENIIVLSNQPERTTALYGVRSVSRWQWFEYIKLFSNTKLLISGGGGLFQDRTGPRSVIFYAAQIFMAKILGAKVFIYAQGLGPLRTILGRTLTQLAFRLADIITVRDNNSTALIKSWKLKGELTADPVWSLLPSPLPNSIEEMVDRLRDQKDKVIGLSLRADPALKDYHLKYLAEAIVATFPHSSVLLLPLQENQDLSLLKQEDKYLKELGVKTLILDSSLLNKPSAWLALMEKLDLVIGMRLHALLMALRSSRPVIGIAYDAKVRILLEEFAQPLLSLEDKDKDRLRRAWLQTIREAENINFNQNAKDKLFIVEQLAQQNVVQLANTLRD